MAKCLLRGARAVLVSICPCESMSILSKVKPPTGEPDAGESLVRFGGRGSRNQSALPTPISYRGGRKIWQTPALQSITISSLARRIETHGYIHQAAMRLGE